MPKLIDYPRTSYTGAWEVAEIVDDTGGKCAVDTAARKLNRKVSGSFKAIIGSAVKFGLMTSKRELLTTTTLFRRIKHAYDKAEELQFHREAFLTPPLFTQLCRKFRNRELPVQMLDVMLIREFGVEEINAQSVAKSFVDGCRMCGLIDERNIIADIDTFSNNRTPRRELAGSTPVVQTFRSASPETHEEETKSIETIASKPNTATIDLFEPKIRSAVLSQKIPEEGQVRPDAIASLFGLAIGSAPELSQNHTPDEDDSVKSDPFLTIQESVVVPAATPRSNTSPVPAVTEATGYQMQMSGPGVNTILNISDEDDLAIAIAMLEKIRHQLRAIQR